LTLSWNSCIRMVIVKLFASASMALAREGVT